MDCKSKTQMKKLIFIIPLALFCSCKENTQKDVDRHREAMDKPGVIVETSDSLCPESVIKPNQRDRGEEQRIAIEEEHRKMMGFSASGIK